MRKFALLFCAVLLMTGVSKFAIAGVPGKIEDKDDERKLQRELKTLTEQLASTSEADRKDAIEKLVAHREKAVEYLKQEMEKSSDDTEKSETLRNALTAVEDTIAFDTIVEDFKKNFEPLKDKKNGDNELEKIVKEYLGNVASFPKKFNTSYKNVQKAADAFIEKEKGYPDILNQYIMKYCGAYLQNGIQLEKNMEDTRLKIAEMKRKESDPKTDEVIRVLEAEAKAIKARYDKIRESGTNQWQRR